MEKPRFRAVRLLVAGPVGFLLSLGSAAAGDYDRPIPEGGGPTEIHCAIGVLDVDGIDDASQNFTVNIFTLMSWTDPREAHAEEGTIRRPLTEVWHPELIFLNRQRIWASLGLFVEITPKGRVSFRRQFWGDFSQPLNLHDFPFDSQTFGMQIVFAGSGGADEIVLIQDPKLPSFVSDDYSVADWKIVKHWTDSTPYAVPSGESVPAYTLHFEAERLSNHYLVKVVAPLLMIVLLSWVVFWLNPAEGGSQLGVAVTSFLTVIAYHVALSSKLPEISYLTRLDVFVFCGTILVFMAMIEVVITTGLAQRGKINVARWLDRVCRILFPVLLVLGGCYAIFWH
jgi:hypothetical protein